PSSRAASATKTNTLSLHDALPISEPSVGGAPGRLDVGDVPGLRAEHAQERSGIHRARAHFQVVSLHQRAAALGPVRLQREEEPLDRKSTRLNSSHVSISYAVFCLK